MGPLIQVRVAILCGEVASGVGVWIERHLAGLRIGRVNARIELLGGEERLNETTVRQDPAIGCRDEVSTLTIVRRDRLRIEGIDVGVGGILRIERQRCGKTLIGRGVPVELRIGVDFFHDADVIGVGNRVDPNRVVSVANRLEEVKLTLLQRPGKGQVRGRAFYAVDVAANPTEARHGIFE